MVNGGKRVDSGPMATTAPRQRSGEGSSAAQLNEEYEAMQRSLEGYLDDRLEQIAGGLDAPVAPAAREGWFRRWRTDLYFGITLVFLVVIWLRLSASPAAPPAGSTPSSPSSTGSKATAPVPGKSGQGANAATGSSGTAPAPETTGAEPAPPFDLDAPDEAWSTFVAAESKGIVPWLRALIAAQGLAADQVSDLQKKNFGGWTDQLAAGKEPLPDVTVIQLRTGLFEYLYGRFVAADAGLGKQWKRVDLQLEAGEYEAQSLAALVEELTLTPWFAPPLDPEDRTLQTAVVMSRIRAESP